MTVKDLKQLLNELYAFAIGKKGPLIERLIFYEENNNFVQYNTFWCPQANNGGGHNYIFDRLTVYGNLVRKLSNFLSMQKGFCQSSCGAVTWKWDLPQISETHRHHLKYAVMVLNRPLTQNQHFVKEFWNNAVVRVTIDGGTLQWDKYLNQMPVEAQKSMKLPDLITGDFDSITDEIMQKYKKKGCKIVHTPDQDNTDFTKSVLELYKYCQEHKTEIDHVIAIGQSSGRIDQVIGNIQTLFLAKEKRLLSPNIRLYLLSDDALSWLLSPGDHVISVPESSRKHRNGWCSLIPIGHACVSVTTSGLKWNLDNQTLKFGEIVSTSNAFDGSETVTVTCSHTVLWSMRVPGVSS